MAPTTASITPTTLASDITLNEGYVVHEKDRAKRGHKDFSDDIPVISLAGIDEDYPGGRREEIKNKVVAACEEWGIFQLVDHGVEDELFTQMFELGRQFFAMSDEYKLRYEMPTGTMGGFLVSSHLLDEVVANWREFIVFVEQPLHARNYSRWPDKPEGWWAVIEEYGVKLMEVSRKLYELLSEALGLDKDALMKTLGEIQEQLVVNHYPKCPQPELAVGLKRHTDPSSMTMLVQDHVGGLQATKDAGKTWATVRPIKNAFVVNLGDQLYWMSNGRFKSADHQAVVNADSDRMSIAMFFNPENEAKVYPLKVKEGEKPLLEEPITFAEMTTKHDNLYLDRVKIKKLAQKENWSQEELNRKLSELEL